MQTNDPAPPAGPGPVTASPVTASPVTASPVTASPVTGSPDTGSPDTGSTDEPWLSLVVPLRDEEPNVAPLVAEVASVLDGRGLRWELLLVDDGSRDRTAARAAAEARDRPEVRALRLGGAHGQGSALQAGFDRARGDVVVSLDGDGQDDPAQIPRLLAALGPGVDAVCGWRVRRREGSLRLATSRLANLARRALLGERVHDVGCTLRAYRAELVRGLGLRGTDHRFLTAWLTLRGARLTEVRVEQRPRLHGRSKYGTLDRALSSLPALVRLGRARLALDRRSPARGARERIPTPARGDALAAAPR